MKKIKITRFLLYVVLATMAMFQVSCSKDDEDDTKETEQDQSTQVSEIVGKWSSIGRYEAGRYYILNDFDKEITHVEGDTYKETWNDGESNEITIKGTQIIYDGEKTEFVLSGDVLREYVSDSEYFEYVRNDKTSTSRTVEDGDSFYYLNRVRGTIGNIRINSANGLKGNRVVEFTITNFVTDLTLKESFTLGEDVDHSSFFMYDGKSFSTAMQSDAVENSEKVILCLSSSADGYTLISGTLANALKATGNATETIFFQK